MPKKYIPNEKEKYMCLKQRSYFKKRLMEWRGEIIESKSKSLYLDEVVHEVSSPRYLYDGAVFFWLKGAYHFLSEKSLHRFSVLI